MPLIPIAAKGGYQSVDRKWLVQLHRPATLGTDPYVALEDLLDASNLGIAANGLGPGTVERTLAALLADDFSALNYASVGGALDALVEGAAFSQDAEVVSHRIGYGSKSTLYLPQGDYVVTAADIDLIGSKRELTIIGAGCGSTRLRLPDGEWLVNSSQSLRSVHMEGVTTVGGAGACRFGFTGDNVNAYFSFADCRFVDYTVCAIGSLSSNHPYINVLNCIFFGATDWTSIGLVLPPQLAQANIIGNAFLRNKYHIKKIGDDSASNIGPNNGFLAYYGGFSGTRVADIWIVPKVTVTTSANDGCGIRGNRFSNENRQEGEYTILIADEDTEVGTDNLDCNVHKTGDNASTKYITGLRLTGNVFGGIGDPSYATQGIIHSEIPRFGGLVFEGNHIIGGHYPAVVAFASGVTPAGGDLRTNVIELPTHRLSARAPKACNIPGWAMVRNPTGRRWVGPEQDIGGASYSSRYANLLTNPGISFSSWQTYAGTTDAAQANDIFGGTNLQRLITFAAETDSLGDTVLHTNIRSGELAWLQFWCERHSIDPLLACEVYLMEDSIETWRGTFDVPSTNSLVRFPIIMRGAASSAEIRFTPVKNYSASSNKVHIADVRFYHAPHPLNFDHFGTHGDGEWNRPHLVIGTGHIWKDTNGNPRWSNSAPISASSGFPFGIKVAVPPTAASTGTLGHWAANTTHLYICVATDTWMRVAIATW